MPHLSGATGRASMSKVWLMTVPKALKCHEKTMADVVTLLMCKPGECVESQDGARLSLRRPSGRPVDISWLPGEVEAL